MIDSQIFGHHWSTETGREIFSEEARVKRWLKIVTALAEAQVACDVIPKGVLAAIKSLETIDIPIDRIADRTRVTSHSTLGMIQVLRDYLPEHAKEYVYYGATVQDISDTAQSIEMRLVFEAFWSDLWTLEGILLELAENNKSDAMLGRTHGQPGAPVSFGFKVAVWADEIGRHLERLKQAQERWFVGQLAGAVGTLGFFGEKALDLRKEFCRALNLHEPEISWTCARDRLCEFAHLLSMAVATMAKIANEVFTLQRREIGELAEKANPNTVGSITMPHKRNPEMSEQVVALNQVVRAQANLLTDTMLQEHERDARKWKIEWAAFPELSIYCLAAVSMTRDLLAGLEVNTVVMRQNLERTITSEQLLVLLTKHLGKHNAQAALQDVYQRTRDGHATLQEALSPLIDDEELAYLNENNIGSSAEMVERVIVKAKHRRSGECAQW